MIYDLDGNELYAAQLTMREQNSSVLHISIECRSGYKLKSETAANLGVEARRLGDSVWTNLESSEIDVSAYAGTRQTFEIKLTAGNETSIVRNAFSLKLTP